MTTEHPITPPPELRQLWTEQARLMHPHDSVARQEHFATQAARWGDEQRLEACCEWIRTNLKGQLRSSNWIADNLRVAMRPKPPSLAVRALIEFESHQCAMETNGCDTDLLRAALERLQELEKGNE